MLQYLALDGRKDLLRGAYCRTAASPSAASTAGFDSKRDSEPSWIGSAARHCTSSVGADYQDSDEGADFDLRKGCSVSFLRGSSGGAVAAGDS